MLKELFDRGKCALGFHSGDWRYASDQRCEQLQICSRCDNQSRQVVHNWRTWQYVASEACDMARWCERCKEQENKTEHVWGAPIYQAAESCEQMRPCSRCGETSSAGTVHNWNSWSYELQGQCSQVSTCSRCGVVGTQKRVSHDWRDWQKSEFYATAVRVCRRCGEMVFGVDQTGKEAVSLQMVNSAVQEVMQAGDVDSVRERITRHRSILLSPATEKYFNFAVDQLAANAEAKEVYQKLAGLIERCRREGVNNVLRPAAPVSPPQPAVSTQIGEQPSVKTNSALDTRLIGHWRHTEILGSGSFMRSIDTHCILDGTGAMQWYSRSASGTGAVESGVWSATNGTLDLHFANGNRLAFVYELDGATMFCPREGRYRLWNRIN
jgi:hypothetical protein